MPIFCSQKLTAISILLGLIFSGTIQADWLFDPVIKPKATTDGLDTLRYSFYTPTTQAEKKYPLVVHLHSLGTGPQNLDHTQPIFTMLTDSKTQSASPHFIMGPVCPQQFESDSKPHWWQQWKWVNADWHDPSYSIDSVQISTSMQWVIDEIKVLCKYYQIDTNRIHVVGGSMGGMGTWDAICRNPKLFASASPLSGPGDPSIGAALTHLAIWSFLREGDQTTPPAGPENMINAIRTAGGLPKLTRFDAGQSHLYSQVWWPSAPEYTPEQIPWMLRQVKSSSAPGKITGVTATPSGSYITNLKWDATNDSIGDPLRIHYQVFRGATLIKTTDSTNYADTSFELQEGKTYSYTVKAFNDNCYFGPTSDQAIISAMPIDNTLPSILDAMDIGDSTTVLVTFTERVDPVSAKNSANYKIVPALTISTATLQPDNKSVKLGVQQMTLHKAYSVTVNNVKDRTGRNILASNSSASFTYDYKRGLSYEYFEFDQAPTDFNSFNGATIKSTGVSDWLGIISPRRSTNYGIHHTGAIIAYEPGVYTFSTNGEDGTRIYIDGNLIVDNPITPAYKEGSIMLTRGKHALEAYYFQSSGPEVWESRFAGPGFERRLLFPTDLMHNPDKSPTSLQPKTHAQIFTSTISLSTSYLGKGVIKICYAIPGEVGSFVKTRLSIYNLQGRLVQDLVNLPASSGNHEILLNTPQNLSALRGHYIAKLQTANFEKSILFSTVK